MSERYWAGDETVKKPIDDEYKAMFGREPGMTKVTTGV
jgi:hypothetical protein